MSTPYSISLEFNPTAEDIQILGDGIIEYAALKTQHQSMAFFAVFLRDENQSICGGCNGSILYGCLYIDQLWVSSTLRSQGYGRQLMTKALEFGVTKQCSFATVNTFDWEALEFYQKLGFEIEFQRTGFDHQSVFYFLRKSLQPALMSQQSAHLDDLPETIIPKEPTLTLIEASLSDYPTIQNLARFYVYDMSRQCGLHGKDWACPENGLYECFDFKKYFVEPHRKAYLIRVNDEVAGFALIYQELDKWVMGEFFIIARFQGYSIAKKAALELFTTYGGKWVVSVIPDNKRALNFWKKTIDALSTDVTQETRAVDFDLEQPWRIFFEFNTAEWLVTSL